MTSLSWFRRIHSELSSPRLFVELEQHSGPNSPRTQVSMRDVRGERFLHLNAKQMQSHQSFVDYKRLGCLYLDPLGENEQFRAKMKYLNAKAQINLALLSNPPDPKSPGPNPVKPDDGTDNQSIAPSTYSNVSSTSSISVSATRNETAREVTFSRPLMDFRDNLFRKVNKVQCPKPNSMSPYSKVVEDTANEVMSLRKHFQTVMKKPKPNVFFPSNALRPSSTEPRFKPRKFDQYYLGSQHGTPQTGRTSSTHNLQSSAANSPNEVSQRHFNHCHYINDDTKYLEMCDPTKPTPKKVDNRRKRSFEVAKMELVSLAPTLKRSRKTTDIHKELKDVLKESMSQTQKEHRIKEQQLFPTPVDKAVVPKSFNGWDSAKETSSTSFCPEVAKLEPPHQVYARSFTNLNAKVDPADSKSLKGMNCYGVLRKRSTKSVRPVKKEEICMPLTDLNDYDDTRFDQRKSIDRVSTKALIIPANKELKIAKQQHNKRFLELFEDIHYSNHQFKINNSSY